MCILRQDISSFAISLIEKRVQGTWFLSVVTTHALKPHHRYFAKLHGYYSPDGPADNHRTVSAPRMVCFLLLLLRQRRSLTTLCCLRRYLSQNHNLMNYINDPRGVKEYLLQ
jgi:hypothetical protein